MLLQNNIIKRQFPNVNGELHSLLVKILPGQADNGAGQKQQAHQVGNGHHAVEGIGMSHMRAPEPTEPTMHMRTKAILKM